MIESFDNIGVAVTDYPRAVDFYKKLGFELDFEEGEGGSMKAGNAVLYVFKTTSGTSPQSRDVSLTGNPPGIDQQTQVMGKLPANLGGAWFLYARAEFPGGKSRALAPELFRASQKSGTDVAKQTFQKLACTRCNTILLEQRTYPLLDLTKRRRPQRKRLFNRRHSRPRSSNHGCP